MLAYSLHNTVAMKKEEEGSGGLVVGTRNSHSPKAGRIFNLATVQTSEMPRITNTEAA